MICPICHGAGTTGLLAAGGIPQRCGICTGSGEVEISRTTACNLRDECNSWAYQLVGLIMATSWGGTLNPHRWSELKHAARMAWSYGMALRLFDTESQEKGT